MSQHTLTASAIVLVLATGACETGDVRVDVDLPVAPASIEEPPASEVELVAAPALLQLRDDGPPTEVWAFNGRVPGPTIHAEPGTRIRVRFTNELPEATTLHWHGLRVSNAMDGTPAVMRPVAPGETFVYDLDVPDAGLFWYHPHVNTHHQVDRGLYGAFLVEPAGAADVPIALIDDWSLDDDNQLVPPTAREDVEGRTGNLLTINSRPQAALAVGESSPRLHLLNGSNATPFAVGLSGHSFRVVAKDGPAVDDPVVLERLRIAPGERFEVELLPVDGDVPEAELIVSPLSRGTMMGGGGARGWTVNGAQWPDVPPLEVPTGELLVLDVSNETMLSHPLHIHGHFFRVLGRTSSGASSVPSVEGGVTLATVAFNEAAPAAQPARLALEPASEQAPVVPLRLGAAMSMGMGGMGGMHGGGTPSGERLTDIDRVALQDTVEVFPGETVRVALRADNPGEWLYHCHVLEHEEGGMMGLLRVVE